MSGIGELEESAGAALLFVASVNVKDGQVDVVEQLSVILDRVTRGEEHHNLNSIR